jgi:hypothetical protein
MRRLALAAALVCAGCGASSSSSSSSPPAAVSALPARAVAYLPSTVKPLTPAFLAREAQAPALRAELGGWGFEAGRRRYFQGESRRLQVVDSRTLRFRGGAGASAFVAFQRTHLNPYLGGFAAVRSFTSAGRAGFVATAQECQCHLANPAYLAAVARGGTVTWLEINGPGATRRMLAALLARAP